MADKIVDQANRLDVAPSPKANLKYDVELKVTKEGRFGYRIIRKTPSSTSRDAEWGGMRINFREEVYVSPPKGFATRLEAFQNASEWIKKYESQEPAPAAPKAEAKSDAETEADDA